MPHEHLTRQNLKLMKQDDIIEIALGLQTDLENTVSNLSSDIKKLNTTLLAEIQELKTSFGTKIREIESELALSRNNSVQLERRCNMLEQYSRRECIEIRGIPATVEHENLVEFITPILKVIDVDLEYPRSIQACHRLSRRNNDVIMKLSHREDRNLLLKNRKQFKDKDMTELGIEKDQGVFINENLCPYFKRLIGMANILKKDNHIFSFWTINGTPRIRIREHDESFVIITHVTDFEKVFPDLNFNTIFDRRV